ncbi:MAG: prolyl oligopeptidase family serine peptidase [Thermoanaerobaculia bacterium]
MTQVGGRVGWGLLLVGAAAALQCSRGGEPAVRESEAAPLSYPETRQIELVETLHGVEVPDPYRWLEDLDSEETKAWVAAQNEVTFGYLEQLPGREALQARLTELWDYPKYGVPFEEGGLYFFQRNSGLQNQSVLYVAEDLAAEPRVLLDPNTLSQDGTISLAGYSVSEDGKYLAYALQSGGSDWLEWHVKEVATGEDLPDHIRWSKFSGAAWRRDGSGFYYSRYDEPAEGQALEDANYFQKVYFHRLGPAQEEDQLVYERPDEKEWGFSAKVSEDDRYLVLSVWKGTDTRNRLFYKDLSRPDAQVVELIDELEAEYRFIDNDGPIFWLYTDLDAPRGKVIAVDTRAPAKESWRTLIPEAEDALQGVNVVADQFVASYLKDAYSVVRRFSMEGEPLGEMELPGLGTVGGFGGERDDTETWYTYTDFTRPGSIYHHDFEAGTSELLWIPELPFDPQGYETRQVFFPSKDGTRIPMFLTARKGVLDAEGARPALLYGYGGFNIPVVPVFSVANLVWMEQGGIYASVNLRGGGEYGKRWHEAGMLHNKQNVFDDFIAAAEWLVGEGYTSPEKLAIRGGSNGGLLVGAVMTQRPGLVAVALPAVGVLDLLRFHKFTIGWAWTSDYGDPEAAEDFRYLMTYSPYHNLEPGTDYPATLLTTADHDDRVVPAHSFKFASRLQAAQAGEDPVLIRIETRAGHGGGKPTTKQIEEARDVLAFALHHVGNRRPF